MGMPTVLKLLASSVVLFVIGCKPTNLAGKTFVSSSSAKYVSIEFLNDSLCQVKQTQYCKSIPEKYQQVDILAHYEVLSFTISGYKPVSYDVKRIKIKAIKLKNVNCDSCTRFLPIPTYFTSGCIGDTAYDRFSGKMPDSIIYQFPNDTMIVHKNVIKYRALIFEQLQGK